MAMKPLTTEQKQALAALRAKSWRRERGEAECTEASSRRAKGNSEVA